jgi:hypothetical protein
MSSKRCHGCYGLFQSGPEARGFAVVPEVAPALQPAAVAKTRLPWWIYKTKQAHKAIQNRALQEPSSQLHWYRNGYPAVRVVHSQACGASLKK